MENQSVNEPISIIQHISPCTVVLELPFILTIEKKLTIGLPYLYLNGGSICAVQLLDVREDCNTVFIKLQDLQTGSIKTASWSKENKSPNLWSIISKAYLQRLIMLESTG